MTLFLPLRTTSVILFILTFGVLCFVSVKLHIESSPIESRSRVEPTEQAVELSEKGDLIITNMRMSSSPDVNLVHPERFIKELQDGAYSTGQSCVILNFFDTNDFIRIKSVTEIDGVSVLFHGDDYAILRFVIPSSP
jgi:hypothetical protein